MKCECVIVFKCALIHRLTRALAVHMLRAQAERTPRRNRTEDESETEEVKI